MELHPKQIEVAKDKTRFRVLCWGRGTGKTQLAIEECIHVAIAKSNRRVVYIGPTIQQTRDVAWSRLRDRVLPILSDKNESRLEVIVKTQDGGTSQILLRGWEAIETLRGQELDFIVIDEVAFMRDFWNGWEKVLRPTLRMSQGGTMFISTPNGFNHFYDLYNSKDPLFKPFHATSYDNPFIAREEIESARASLPEDTFAQEYMADFRKVEGLVYKEFDSRHVIDKVPLEKIIAKRGCIDFGFTNPAAMYTVGRDGDANYYIYDEFYETGKLQDELNQQMSVRKLDSWYPDHAEADRLESMRRAGLRVNEISKDVRAGIDTVQNLLKQNRLFIHKDCTNLIFEFNFYRWRPKTGSKIDLNEPEEPIKEHDHGLDAVRYALHMWEATHRAPLKDNYIPDEPLFSDIGI